MSRLSLTAGDWVFIGLIFQGFFYGSVIHSISFNISAKDYTRGSGIYSAIFAIYLRHQASKKCADNRLSIIFCSLCTLYVLSVAVFAMDIARFVLVVSNTSVCNNFNFSSRCHSCRSSPLRSGCCTPVM